MTKYCWRCNSKLKEGSSRCISCGAKINNDDLDSEEQLKKLGQIVIKLIKEKKLNLDGIDNDLDNTLKKILSP